MVSLVSLLILLYLAALATVGPIGFLGPTVGFGLEILFGIPNTIQTQIMVIVMLMCLLYTCSGVNKHSMLSRSISVLESFAAVYISHRTNDLSKRILGRNDSI